MKLKNGRSSTKKTAVLKNAPAQKRAAAKAGRAAVKPGAPESASVSKTDYEHLAAFRHTLREFLYFSEEAALAAGVRPQQHQALLAIHGLPDRDCLTVGELAARLKIKHHSAVGLANRMETEGLVAKAHAEGDRRQVLVRLTPLGKRTLEKLSAAHKAELIRIGPVLREIFTHLKTFA